MKYKLFLIIGLILMTNLVSASITIISPTNGSGFSGYSDKPISFTSSSGGVSVYVSNDTNFDDDGKLICTYAGSGANVCNFTAFRTSHLSGNLQSHYKFGDGSGSLTVDSGLAPKSSVTNTGVVQEENCGMLESCSEYNGGTDRLDYGDVRDILLGKNVDWTITTWAKADVGSEGTTRQLFHKNDDSPSMHVSTNNNFVSSIYFNTGCSPRTLSTPINSIETGIWYQFTMVHDATANTVTHYINGVQGGTIADTCYNPLGAERIGGEGATDRSFDGVIDEFLMMNTIVTSEDLDAMYIYKDGEYCFKINNTAGDSETGCFIKDSVEPLITITAPRYETKNGFINLTVTDEQNISMVVLLNGVEINSTSLQTSPINYINQTILSRGDYNLTVIATDIVGNIARKEKLFSVIKIKTINIFHSPPEAQPNLVNCGDFTCSTDWTFENDWENFGGSAYWEDITGVGSDTLEQTINIIENKEYNLTFELLDFESPSGSILEIYLGGTLIDTYLDGEPTGIKSYIIHAGSNGKIEFHSDFGTSSETDYWELTDVSVKKTPEDKVKINIFTNFKNWVLNLFGGS